MDMMQTFEPSGPLIADEIAAAMAGKDLDLENLGLHGGYGNISATIAEILYDHAYNAGAHTFRLNGSRVGGFPLTPSDIPYAGCALGKTTSQSLSASSTTDIDWDQHKSTPTSDFTHSTSSSKPSTTINTSKPYRITGFVGLTAGGAGSGGGWLVYTFLLLKNSTELLRIPISGIWDGSSKIQPQFPIAWAGDLASGDVIKAQIITPAFAGITWDIHATSNLNISPGG